MKGQAGTSRFLRRGLLLLRVFKGTARRARLGGCVSAASASVDGKFSLSVSLSVSLPLCHTHARTHAGTDTLPSHRRLEKCFFIFPIGRDTLLNALLLYIPALREISGKDKQSEGVGGVQAVCQSLRPDWRLRVALRCDPFRGNSCEQSHDPDGESEA